MKPCFSFNDSSDCSFVTSKFFGQFFICDLVWNVSFSNFYDFFVSKFREILRLSVTHPKTRSCIKHIYFLGSKIKMFWIRAGWIVATVANKHSIRDFSEMYFPGNAMNQGSFPVFKSYAVSPHVFGRNPVPATIFLDYIFPISVRGWLRSSFEIARSATSVSCRMEKFFPAAWAMRRHSGHYTRVIGCMEE